MSGHVFHPGHEELHGVTVVLDLADGGTIVGRYHETSNGQVLLHDAAVRSTAAPDARDAFLARIVKYGVPPEHRVLRVPEASVTGLVKLADVA